MAKPITFGGSCFLKIQCGKAVPKQNFFGNTGLAQKQHSGPILGVKSAFVHLTVAIHPDWKTYVLQVDLTIFCDGVAV